MFSFFFISFSAMELRTKVWTKKDKAEVYLTGPLRDLWPTFTVQILSKSPDWIYPRTWSLDNVADCRQKLSRYLLYTLFGITLCSLACLWSKMLTLQTVNHVTEGNNQVAPRGATLVFPWKVGEMVWVSNTLATAMKCCEVHCVDIGVDNERYYLGVS